MVAAMATLFDRLAPPPPPPPPAKKAQEPLPDPELRAAQRMLNWLQRWPKNTVCTREILIYGPYSLRNPKSAIGAAEILVKNGCLTPAKPHRYDMRKWYVVRKPIIPPTIAT
jgi:hypothetical protein